MRREIKNRSVAVFGAYGLIGTAIVRHVINQGGHVIALGRDQEKLEQLANSHGGKITTRQLDFSTSRVTPTLNLDRPIDMVLTPLGGRLDTKPFMDVSPKAFLEPINNKLAVQVAAVQSALPLLSEKGEIVLFSGLLSRHPMQGMSTMTATNAAIEALVTALALELDPIRVTCISPTQVETTAEINDGSGSSVTPDQVALAALNAERKHSGVTIDVL